MDTGMSTLQTSASTEPQHAEVARSLGSFLEPISICPQLSVAQRYQTIDLFVENACVLRLTEKRPLQHKIRPQSTHLSAALSPSGYAPSLV
jgi:hypothetical protein